MVLNLEKCPTLMFVGLYLQISILHQFICFYTEVNKLISFKQ